MAESFEINITGRFEEVCGTWIIEGKGFGNAAMEIIPVRMWGMASYDGQPAVKSAIDRVIHKIGATTFYPQVPQGT